MTGQATPLLVKGLVPLIHSLHYGWHIQGTVSEERKTKRAHIRPLGVKKTHTKDHMCVYEFL